MRNSNESSTTVSVIIVTYNSASCIRECVISVLAQTDTAAEIIVVDNASADDTANVVRSFGGDVNLIANRDNIGFGRGCNQGFAASHGRFIYFLNPDARLVERDDLAQLGRALQAHPQWGLAATRVVSVEGQDESTPATTYPGQARARNDFDRLPGKIAWVIGASLFVRREVFTALGGFDPDFFIYSEETDLCLRLRKLGHEIGLVAGVTVRHIGAVSEAGRDPYDTWTRKLNGLHLFWKKHYAPEDAARLVRRDLWRARVRMILNGVMAAFQPPRSRAWEKYRRYRAIRDASVKFLSAK